MENYKYDQFAIERNNALRKAIANAESEREREFYIQRKNAVRAVMAKQERSKR